MNIPGNVAIATDNILFDIFLKHTPDHVYYKDRESKFIRCSERHARWLGVNNEADLLGKTDFDFFSTEHSSQAFWDEQRIMTTGKPMIDFEEKETFADGSERWVKTSKWPLRNSNGDIIGTFGISHDITDRKKAEHLLRVRQNFMADMSHEIRTPMNAIMGLSKLLSKTNLDDIQQGYLKTIVRSGENLLAIISDLLDISKVESGKLELENIGIRLDEIISTTLTGFRQKAEEKNIALRSSIDSSLSEIHCSDPVRIGQILNNLVSNAIKFTDQGYVAIECSLLERRGNTEMVCLKVADTGVGMIDTSRIFNSFEQENRSITRKYGGTGLGLSICHKLVTQFNGTIEVSSQYGKGSVFTVVLPLQAGCEADVENDDPFDDNIAQTNTLEGMRVLVVDDVDVNCFIAKKTLNDLNAVVETAENGREAIQKLERETFDLILMDTQMPLMDGIATTRYIREIMKLSTPIIALTANAMSSERQHCIEAGMNDFLSKPFDKYILLQKIKDLYSKPSEQSSVNGSSHALFASEGPVYTLENVKKLSNGDIAIHDELLHRLIQTISTLLDEMKEHHNNAEFYKLKGKAHSLKSPITFLNVKSVQPILRELESGVLENDKPKMLESIKTLDQILQYVLDKIKLELKESKEYELRKG